jgi:hypothetical protein
MRDLVLLPLVHLCIRLALALQRLKDGVPAKLFRPSGGDDGALCAALEEDGRRGGRGGVGKGADGGGALGGEAGEHGIEAWKEGEYSKAGSKRGG